MKKRLLLAMAAILGFTTAFAYQTGEYIYTRNGKFKVVSENLITNGDFKDGLNGWLNVAGETPSEEMIQVNPSDGPDGLPFIQATESGSSGARSAAMNTVDNVNGKANLFISIPRASSKIYVFSMKVKSGDDNTKIVTSNSIESGRNANLIAFYPSVDGTLETIPQSNTTKDADHPYMINRCWEGFGNDGWTEIAYDYTSLSDGYLCALITNMAVNTRYADIGLYEVQAVGDDRLTQNLLTQLKFYKDHPEDFPAMQDELGGIITELENYNPDATVDDLSGYLNGIQYGDESFFTYFFGANTVDVSDKLTNFYFDSGSASKAPFSGWSVSSSDRWFSEAKHGNYQSQHVKWEISAAKSNDGYTMRAADYYQKVNLAAGKYMYMVQASANIYGIDGGGSKSDAYVVRHDYNVEGAYAFIVCNGDTTKIPFDNLSTWYGNIYTVIVDLPEGEKTFGFHIADGPSSAGGKFCFDNLQLRIVGGNKDEVDYEANLASLAKARDLFQQGIDVAQAVADSTAFIYGRTELLNAIEDAKGVLLAHGDEVIVKGDNDASLAAIQEVTDAHAALDVARRAMVTLNAEYVILGKDLEKAKAAVADETRPKAKDAFQSVITEADTYYKAQTETSRDSLALMQADEKLLKASEAYYIANATYATPGDLFIQNYTFAQKGTTYRASGDPENTTPGWVQDGKHDNGYWQYGTSDKFVERNHIYYNRGTGANDAKWIYQDVTIGQTGVYEFVLDAAVHLSSNDGTNYDTGAKIYIGNDSVTVVSDAHAVGGQNWGDVATFRVMTVVNEMPADGKLRIGFDRQAIGAVCNMMYLSNCHLLYYGPYDQYKKDSIAVVLQPTKDALQVAVDEAKALLAEVRNPNNVDTTPFSSVIDAAQAVVDNADATLDAVEAQFPALENATNDFVLSGVWPAEGKYFDHSILLKNAKFNEADDSYKYWDIAEGSDSLAIDNTVGAFAYKHQPTVGAMTQEVTGLKQGEYTFTANAAYRYDWQMSWTVDGYEKENVWFFITANDEKAAIPSLMTGATVVNPDDLTSALVYANGKNMTIYNARHIHDTGRQAWMDLFNSGLFEVSVPFTPAEGKATVGFSVEGVCNTNCAVAFANPRLLFWGDNAVIDAIDAPVTTTVADGAVYSITGVKLNGVPAKGLYIRNGKKFVVK